MSFFCRNKRVRCQGRCGRGWQYLIQIRYLLAIPRFGLGDVKYYNPHFFRINGYSDQVPRETLKTDETARHDLTAEENPHVSDSAVVDSILDSLAHHVDIGQISVDHRIKSALLPHQKEAIDFISCRERGQLSSDLSLWKYNDVDADETFYQHVFTGAKRPERDEAKGGIIADEMGLGKSLVILSTVAGTLDRAGDFLTTETQALEAQQVRKMPSRATLILAPSSLLIDSWVDEIRKHTYPGALSFHKHLGSRRHAERDLLQQRMIVFTTYATVATEFCRGDTGLAQIKWFRIVLDEAHVIRNRFTKQFQAVANLSAQHRWCLTGTPIQNSLEDLGALATFLKVPILENAPTFRRFVTTPITTGSKGRFENLRSLLQTICLRRTRELLDLPEPIPQIRRLPLTQSERGEYDELLRGCRTKIDMAVSGRRKGRINSTVLESLLKLRLFCNNGNINAVFNMGPKGLPADPDEALTYLQQFDQNICAYCSGTIYSLNDTTDADGGIILPSCYHLVCRGCMPHHRARGQRCPTCVPGEELLLLTGPSGVMHAQPWGVYPHNGTEYPSQYPTKLLALLADIWKDTTHKSIVFSCWKKTLSIVGDLLLSHSIRYDMIDGSLPLTERLKVLKDFRSPSGANILLMTLGTGAVGLNLAVASRIYLLEPQWNPSIESQAIGRALRLGQTAQVVIIRYIMEHTVEEVHNQQSNVLSRQRTKLQLAGGGFGKGKDAASERLQSMLVR
ncbi:hypothetical protein K469DRAFT_676470 [Zopfia rhizophila CBS 207.26]|uniref:Uncharacterized protein n=1 Tax=Zopfia rhizophila CBS 207.26 TaxID=1314779 RepID=A0A6A6DFS5_9PEZI|nr:hypothetical protein K469DRAFT_676470 [Zopfia rhizophila CBS 207.26]